MFFKKNLDDIKIEDVNDAQTAKLYLQEEVEKKFNLAKPEMLKTLEDKGLSEVERDNFMKEFRQEIEKEVFKRYRQILNQSIVKNENPMKPSNP